MLEGDAKARQVFCDALRLDDRVEPGSDRVSVGGTHIGVRVDRSSRSEQHVRERPTVPECSTG